jgi:hypothetical protein
MNKKFIIGILALAAILIIAIILGYSLRTEVAACSSIENDYGRYLCYQDLAVKSKDPSICENIVENPYWKDSCFAFTAPAKGDWQICNNIPSEDENMRQACLSDVAVATNDASLCSKMDNSTKDRCPVCLPCWPDCPPLQ